MLRIHDDFVYKMLRILQPHDQNVFSTFKSSKQRKEEATSSEEPN